MVLMVQLSSLMMTMAGGAVALWVLGYKVQDVQLAVQKSP